MLYIPEKNVKIDKLTVKSFDLLGSWLKNKNITKHLYPGWSNLNLNKENISVLLMSPKHLLYYVIYGETVAGFVGLSNIDRSLSTANFWGLTGIESLRGKGIYKSGAYLICNLAFKRLELQNIKAVTHEGNYASKKALESIGMRTIGLSRNSFPVGDTFLNSYILELLPNELILPKSKLGELNEYTY